MNYIYSLIFFYLPFTLIGQDTTSEWHRSPSHYVYQLAACEAIATPTAQPTTSELAMETINVQLDFPLQKTKLFKHSSQPQILLSAPRITWQAFEKRPTPQRLEWFIPNQECPSCSKTVFLTIESESSNTLIYILESEDENAFFQYRLIFSLISNP